MVLKYYFSFCDMFKLCENIIFKFYIDFVFFVVYVDEFCLLFNDSKVESGYIKVYRVLLDVIGKFFLLLWWKYILLIFFCFYFYICFREFVL